MWYWFDKDTEEWILAGDSDEIENEYQSELNGSRPGQRVYHCFGNGWSACINFDKMKTYCSSAKCILTHKKKEIPDDHLTYQLKRDISA